MGDQDNANEDQQASEGDDRKQGAINDPLTNKDADAPQEGFSSGDDG